MTRDRAKRLRRVLVALMRLARAVVRSVLGLPPAAQEQGPRIVQLPSGGRVAIRPIGWGALEWAWSSAPKLEDFFDGRPIPDQIPRDVLEELERFRDEIILRGVVDPKLYADSTLGATPQDFDEDDRARLMGEILRFSRQART